jgi:hypothetical protein
MSSGIVAENIRLKRAYDSAGSGDGTRILIDRLWPRGSRKADAAIDVWPRILLLAQRCGGGSDTILLVGTSFDAATRKKYISVETGHTNYVHSLGKARLHSFLQHVMKLTTTPLS